MVHGETMRIKDFTWRIWLLTFFLILSFLFIINFQALSTEGVIVKNIDKNSTLFTQGLRSGDIITNINGNPTSNMIEYSEAISSPFNGEEVKLTITTTKAQYVVFTSEIPEITVAKLAKTNINAGLDLQGGARALVKPEIELDSSEMRDLISTTTERLNVYGLSDVSIRPVRDLTGNSFMLIEIAGATPKDLENLISKQGKFEAKIGDEVVFVGGNNDITYVCRNDANCAGVSSCQPSQSGQYCNYEFTIHLSEAAARRHADITGKLGNDASNPRYLDKQIDFYVDDILTNSLYISENLKGQISTQIQIQGSGSGIDQGAAIDDAEESMKQQQTILITGSLPYKLTIEKLDTISPVLGSKFTKLIFLTAVIALFAVAIIVFFRYKKLKASFALLFTSFSELAILLGVASLINWSLDLPSIVGILVMIGTGVDQQIIILDESLSKRQTSLNQKIKGALFIVVAAYFTTFFSLLPLFWAGAGLLKGFAVTTLIGLTIGVLITRPAFADMLKLIAKNDASE